MRRPVDETAEEQGGEACPERGVAAEQRDGDPEEADRGRLHVDRPEVVQVAEHVDPAREPGEPAGDRHRAQVVRAHLDPAVRRRSRVVADRAHLVAERRPVEDEVEDDERRQRDEEADMEPLQLLRAPEDRQLRAVGDVVRDRHRRV